MKKFLALIAALVMVFAVSATAFAANTDQVHNGTLPYTSEQDAKITITALHAGGDNDGTRLPSEYHVRVRWNKQDGIYNATATDTENGFKNFTWNCESLEYELGEVSEGATDIREGNWATEPAVSFEVTNASTPDLHIFATPSLSGADAWAGLLKAATIKDQNDTIGTQDVPPVLVGNMGTGVDSYEQNLGKNSHNVYAYTYTFNWDYDALNQMALDAYKNGNTIQPLVNTFVVTITAAAPTPVTGD